MSSLTHRPCPRVADCFGTIALESHQGLLSGFGQNDDAFEARLMEQRSHTEAKMRAVMAMAAEEVELKAAKEAEEARERAVVEANERAEAQAAREAEAAAEAQAAMNEEARAIAEARADEEAKAAAEMKAAKEAYVEALKEATLAREAVEEAKRDATEAKISANTATPAPPSLMEMAVVVGGQLGIATTPLIELVRVASEKLEIESTNTPLKERLKVCYEKVIAMGYGMAMPAGYTYGVALKSLPLAVPLNAIPMAMPFTAYDAPFTAFEVLPMAVPIASPEIGEAIPVGMMIFPETVAKAGEDELLEA